MRRQSIIALAVAVVLGLVAVYLANAYWSARDAQADSASRGTIKVAVAAVPLDYGVAVTPDKVRFASYPASSLPPGVYRSMAQLIPQGKARVRAAGSRACRRWPSKRWRSKRPPMGVRFGRVTPSW